jgi:oligo-1,6-glucosidase
MLEKAKGVGDFLNEMAEETFRKYDAFTVGEVFNEKPEELPLFIGDKGYFSSMFDFAETILNKSGKGWYDHQPVTPEQYKAACFGSQRKVEGVGFLSNIIENHDEPRGVSHYIPKGECTETSKKLLGGLNFMLKGLPFIYQGQELGMENVDHQDISEIDDISSLDEYQVALDAGCSPKEALEAVNHFSRDNARTPYQWNDSPNGGFTTGTPWLKVNPNYTAINLAEQKERKDSVWNFYRQLIELRRNPVYHETVIYGTTVPYLEEQKNLMAYYRKGDKTLLVAGNFQTQPQDMALPAAVKQVLMNNVEGYSEENGVLHLEGYQFVVLELED